MNQKDKLIYEHIADKTLSFGCKVSFRIENKFKELGEFSHLAGKLLYMRLGSDLELDEFRILSGNTVHIIPGTDIKNILGHEPHIGNCLKWIEEQQEKSKDSMYMQWMNGMDYETVLSTLCFHYKNKSETLMHPDNEEAKQYILTLIEGTKQP